MADKINWFRGEWDDLSNFPDCVVTLDGVEYRSVEHAYQAAKTLDLAKREIFTLAFNPRLTAKQAKKIGRKLKLRSDWEQEVDGVVVKDGVMFDLLLQKFGKRPYRDTLMNSLGRELEEGNWWHDIYWGVCYGGLRDGFQGKTCREWPHEPFGKNRLGHLLMKVRGVV